MTEQRAGGSSGDMRGLTRLYILALTAVALLTIAGQALIQISLSGLQGDTTTINIAGRQRMLSQRLARLALQTSQEQDEQQLKDVQQEIGELLAAWQENHANL